MNEARTACEAAEALWNDEASTALPPGTAIANLNDALPDLRGLRAINETVSGLTRQIAGMTRDRDAFTAHIRRLRPASSQYRPDRRRHTGSHVSGRAGLDRGQHL